MRTQQGNAIVEDYLAWIRRSTTIRETGEWWEITTPFLDRHNDMIQLYARTQGEAVELSDDGYTIADLESSGCSVSQGKRARLLEEVLNGFRVARDDHGALTISSKRSDLPNAVNRLLQASLAVSDLFYLARNNVASVFADDVLRWLDTRAIRYVPRLILAGRSRLDHQFDFVIPKSTSNPERVGRIINNPSVDRTRHLLFSWLDTQPQRDPDSIGVAFLNDRDNSVGLDVVDALHAYDVRVVKWTERENALDLLAG